MNARDERDRPPHWSVGVYAALLWLYPPSLRREYGGDMLQAFRDTLRDEVRCRGRRGALRAWSGALGDLAGSLRREWPHELREMRNGSPLGWSRVRWVRRNAARARLYGRANYSILGRSGRRTRRWVERTRSTTMQGNFNKFTERGRKVLSLAQEEAQRFNHNYIGTEHLLLGLIREEQGVGARALINLGVELERARQQVEFIIGRGDRIVLGDIGLTPRAKKVIELAVDEARRLGHHYVGTEHILLGLIREGEGIAAGVLESLGVTLERARAEVMTMLAMPGVTRSTPAEQFPLGLAAPYLTLICRDVDATAAFYVAALGARATLANDTSERALVGEGRMLRLSLGGLPGHGLSLALRPATPEEVAASLASAVGAIELRFIASDIAALHATLAARNIASLTDLAEVPGAPTMRAFTLTDPDRRLLRFQGNLRA